tara:strand:- start:1962 stop:2264 length:303 start_codon:yes stop_codon:yes gene_type:complete
MNLIKVKYHSATDNKGSRLSASNGDFTKFYSYNAMENEVEDLGLPSTWVRTIKRAASHFIEDCLPNVRLERVSLQHGTFKKDDYFFIEHVKDREVQNEHA